MKRRSVLLGSTLALVGCSSLLQRPYEERRQWPLVVRRPAAQPLRRNGHVLLVRSIAAAPGLSARGLQWLEPDGSLHVDFYEEWIVSPNEAVENDLRQWLADSGLFAAVIGPGSRLTADFVLEGTLTAFVANPAMRRARAVLSIALIDQRASQTRALMQHTFTAEQPLANTNTAGMVEALRAAVASLLRQVEQAIAVFAKRR
ncbi:MAG: membrane integrity-associated transporter subunit PqiC [Acetobacteraceae bacterium]|nr:membrane integrity-associated transporter subunit PqiC [Acetobacteraceae bacterium]